MYLDLEDFEDIDTYWKTWCIRWRREDIRFKFGTFYLDYLEDYIDFKSSHPYFKIRKFKLADLKRKFKKELGLKKWEKI